jgi:hypothetical protein
VKEMNWASAFSNAWSRCSASCAKGSTTCSRSPARLQPADAGPAAAGGAEVAVHL